jgi:formylglycine-generating enzyme required for sulfatase activity
LDQRKKAVSANSIETIEDDFFNGTNMIHNHIVIESVPSAIENFRSTDKLKEFKFQVLRIDIRGEIIDRDRRYLNAQSFIEPGINLEMVKIPMGKFLMGSPISETGHIDDGRESPLHWVKIPEFLMGKYPVTQAQWRFVAGLPQVMRWLDPNPSHFKGDQLPVERVSWRDAQEFCYRLSDFTPHIYRLPSEAEWEYACRAGTTTPFAYGVTITGELANYNCRKVYAQERIGNQRGQTTLVGKFRPNDFGLYDMHGNVWEWCADGWHGNYQGAPTDGSVWIGDSPTKILRGGSWLSNPRSCRSSYRNGNNLLAYFVGLRVVCGITRIL